MLKLLRLSVQGVWRCWYCTKNRTQTTTQILLDHSDTTHQSAIGLVCLSHTLPDLEALFEAKRLDPLAEPRAKELIL